jgi:hypothetical protein
VVVTTAEPAEFVMVATRGTVVTALRAADATEATTETTTDGATPVALASADDRTGRAARLPDAEAATPAHWAAPQATAAAESVAEQAWRVQSRRPYAQLLSLQKQVRSPWAHWNCVAAMVAMLLAHICCGILAPAHAVIGSGKLTAHWLSDWAAAAPAMARTAKDFIVVDLKKVMLVGVG